MRELTNAEKLVFGADAKIDEVTGQVIEQGKGALTAVQLNAQRKAQAEHNAEHERLQKAEKTLTDQLAEAQQRTEAAETALADLKAAQTANPSTTGATDAQAE